MNSAYKCGFRGSKIKNNNLLMVKECYLIFTPLETLWVIQRFASLTFGAGSPTAIPAILPQSKYLAVLKFGYLGLKGIILKRIALLFYYYPSQFF